MTPTFTGQIVQWDDEKGYGWVESKGQRIFLHRREFSERHKRPEVGDAIRFIVGTDPSGRTCAQSAVHVNDGGSFGAVAAAILLLLLVLPALALARLPFDGLTTGGLAMAVSLLTYLCYAVDKRRAREKQWRLAESSLHLLEFAGGWPGAFVAQRRLRHKCSKRSYQAVFWLIVLLYQTVSLDFLRGWPFFFALMRAVQSSAAS